MGKPHQTRKQEIIEAAMELAAEHGVKRVTTQAIADRVGIAQPTVFRHFKTRDAIFAAAIEFLAGRLFGALEGIFSSGDPADQRLERLIQRQLAFIGQHKGLPRLLFSDRLHLESPALKRAVQGVMEQYTGRVAAIIAEGQRDGLFREELDPQQTARYVAALVQGVVMRWSIFDFGFRLDEEAGALWRFLHGALARRTG